MERRALIIYCDNTSSGPLPGPSKDNENFVSFLQSNLGGNWGPDEIESLHNPSKKDVLRIKRSHLDTADYSFVVFSGHGNINVYADGEEQMLETADGEISIFDLRTEASRQTLIVDACRAREFAQQEPIVKSADLSESLKLGQQTREIFDKHVQAADQGWSVLFAASENESARDTFGGAAFLLSLLRAAKHWSEVGDREEYFPLNLAHEQATQILRRRYVTDQHPQMIIEKRRRHFPFAVKRSGLRHVKLVI